MSSKFQVLNRVWCVVCLLCFSFHQGVYAALPIQKIAVDLADLGKDLAHYSQSSPSFKIDLIGSIEFRLKEIRLVKSFEQLAESIGESIDSYVTTQQFAQSFIDQINLQKETSHSISDVCQNVRENIDSLQVPLEYREYLLQGLDALESDNPALLNVNADSSALSKGSFKFSWPWDWNWFGLNSKNKPKTIGNHACALSGDEPKVIAFALFLCAVAVVAIFAPATLGVVVGAITAGAAAIL